MKSIFFALLLTVLVSPLYAQKTVSNEYGAIDKRALSIPDSLTTSTVKIANYISSNSKATTTRSGRHLSG
ncbi:MAG TPA: hypothetical protein VF691_14335 [Cytophagaceae bacterium]